GGGAVKVMAAGRDGQRVLAVTEDRTARVWAVHAATQSPPPTPPAKARGKVKSKAPPARAGQPTAPPGTADPVSWSPDADVTAAALAPDGRSALLGGADGSLRLWQLPP